MLVEARLEPALGLAPATPWGGRYGMGERLLRVLGIVLVVPVAEELVFRSALFTQLARTCDGAGRRPLRLRSGRVAKAGGRAGEVVVRQADELDGMLTFLRSAERLKTVTRSGWTSDGQRESVAEHTWRLCLMAMVLYGRADGIDLGKLLRMCVVHDLGEAIGGDIPAPEQRDGAGKADRERGDLLELVAPLPEDVSQEIVELWDEYEAAASPEARVAKGLDKLETILQHTQGSNPADFDYAFNLAYGQRYTAADPLLSALRERLDAETARRAAERRR